MSNKVEVNESNFQQLQGKVVVITGGANGIGAATVRILVQAGAHVVVGDFDQAAGQKLAETFNDAPTKPTFVQMDVAKYEDNVRLFRTALETHGRVDHALACAGILERGKWFDPALTVETIDKPETTKVIDVNFVASAHFARIAMVFLKHDRRQGEDKSIVLISSAAGFRDSPGLFMYQASKHALLGLLRATRKILYERDQIRINAICPALSDTQMGASIVDTFRAAGAAVNTAEEVAKYIVGLEVATEMNGKAVYVEGGRGWEIMDGLETSMPAWLGEEPTARLRQAVGMLKSGEAWKLE